MQLRSLFQMFKYPDREDMLMAVSDSTIDSLLNRLESSLEFRERFRKAIGIDDEYARKSDLEPIQDRIDLILQELRNLKEENNRIWKEIRAMREEMEKGFEKVWKELEAQREEMTRQREEMEKGFEKVWNEMARQREETSKHFEKIWQEVAEIKIGVDKPHHRLDKHEEWLRSLGGAELEMKSFRWFQAVLDAKGEKIDNVKWRVTLKDPAKRLDTEEIELDIFSEDPLYVVEITNYIDDIKKLTKFKKKVEFVRET